VSENAAADVLCQGVDAGRVRVVPNGVDVDRFATARPNRGPFDADTFVIAFAGLFYPWHGVRNLAEAFAVLHRRRPAARLTLLGDGAEAGAVRALLARHDLEPFVFMPGVVPVDDVPGFLKGADVLASPHAPVKGFIGSPVKVFEYMAAGRPIVASRLAQIGTILKDGETALLVPPGDVEGLAAALERLHDDPALRPRLGQAAQEDSRRNHSWDARVDAILAT
jgi:glycosyltransferase involved in cell wall biosynthesis